jgi:3-oxoacyl-[acyl-carrier-protein] synthase-3
MASYIKGTGSYIPEEKISNRELSKRFGIDKEWIFQRTGIIERRRSSSKGVVDMAFPAVLSAIERAKLEREDVSAIIFATVTPEFLTPSSACVLQSKLRIKRAIAFDISAACSGFIYGLFLSSMVVEKIGGAVLVVGAEYLTRFVNYNDRNTSILFGDGAGAVIVGKDPPGHKILDFYITAEGEGWKSLLIPAGGARLPASERTVKLNLHTFKMKGKEVFRNAISGMEEAITKLIEKNGIKKDDISMLIPHQANERITIALAERLGMEWKRVYSNIFSLGNTSSASIPIALDEIERKKILKKGDLVCMASFGAGYTFGACLMEW